MLSSLFTGFLCTGIFCRHSLIKERKILEMRKAIRTNSHFSREESLFSFFGFQENYDDPKYNVLQNKFIIDLACEENNPKILRFCSDVTERDNTHLFKRAPSKEFFLDIFLQIDIKEGDVKCDGISYFNELLKISRVRETLETMIKKKDSEEDIRKYVKENKEYVTLSIENDIKKLSYRQGYRYLRMRE